ncbi:PHD finger protein ALFIN-LIKE 3-like [Leguminivora glycinivorella]|uniref:PHD finger protein ALFIN-LIKE 3-like n=1 Tax=Leguminivora glycinivorella TaxID=1035111 RepID=UPI00200C94C9|nr:PHD finger protein ALFIN-LIKE 3-like [Leguminivora glycinivorella]
MSHADFAPSFVTDRPEPSIDVVAAPGPSGLQQSANKTVLDTAPDAFQESSNQDAQTSGTEFTARNDDPQPGTSKDPPFTPEIIRPLPKAPPRTMARNKRRVRKSAILTDTPEKNAIAEEQANKKQRIEKVTTSKKGKGKQTKAKTKAGKNTAKRRVLQEENEEDDDECYCLICCDSYSNSQPGEQWIQCSICKKWSHSKCVHDENCVTYTCPNCFSDYSDSD